MPSELAPAERHLQPTFFLDYQHSEIRSFGKHLVGRARKPVEIAKRLYLGVRDSIRYNAYTFRLEREQFRASNCLMQGESYCIPKAVLLAALCRLYGIPSRIGLADVKNHLASQQLLDYLRSEVFVMHGYTELWLNDRWVKATPAFDAGLCKLMNINALEFNGLEDSIFHAFNKDGSKHMDYLRDHGQFDDLPLDFIIDGIRTAYPHLQSTQTSAKTRSLYNELSE